MRSLLWISLACLLAAVGASPNEKGYKDGSWDKPDKNNYNPEKKEKDPKDPKSPDMKKCFDICKRRMAVGNALCQKRPDHPCQTAVKTEWRACKGKCKTCYLPTGADKSNFYTNDWCDYDCCNYLNCRKDGITFLNREKNSTGTGFLPEKWRCCAGILQPCYKDDDCCQRTGSLQTNNKVVCQYQSDDAELGLCVAEKCCNPLTS